jgi:transcriptional regulator with XRE-family HTH domain
MKISEAVAENIHRIRKTENLSMERLAELSGVSGSMLGQIERGGVNPTISVLNKIAAGLHVPLSDLIVNEEESSTTVYRALESTPQRLEHGKVIRYSLYPMDGDGHSESWETNIFISGTYTPADHIPGSQIYLSIISGTLEVRTDTESWILESRDSIHLHGETRWVGVNASNNTVRMVVTILYKH